MALLEHPHKALVVEVTEDSFSMAHGYEQALQGRTDIGAVVSFTGLVRDFNESPDVLGLTLEHYPGMTERSLMEIADQAWQRWSLQAVRIIHRVGDSTNAPMPGQSASEGDVAKALASTLAKCKGRVVVSCFASNLARVLAIGRAAQACGRRVSLMGRSMERMVSVARGLGYLDDFPALVPPHDLGYLPPEEVVIIATGSQGEPRAALQRLAQRRHPFVDLELGDSVIFSAKAIPGNERPIEQLKKRLLQLGVDLFDENNHPELHATGHPAQEELKKLYQWVRPKALLPVHGEARHQQAHQALAEQLGISAPLAPVNGDMIALDNQGLRLETRHPQPPCIVDQNSVRPHPGLEHQTPGARRGSLFLALPVTATETGWWRIGRMMLDTTGASPLDEESFSDWLDEQLEEIEAETLADLRQALQPRLMHWLTNHLQNMPEVHLQIMAADMPTVEELDRQ